jgi:glyoxylase-like metal-dependent hydrolase (beta-lactamase superfamily II)/alkylhydroperoxidase/carboxymuconolactone decarboxylase family protein YurZ
MAHPADEHTGEHAQGDDGHEHVHVGASTGRSFPAPVVDTSRRDEIAPGVFVIPDQALPMVPNIGMILGGHSALVIDTGLGPTNGAAVLAAAKEIAGDRRLLLTTTHYHAEHATGVQSFRGHASIVYNRAQRNELIDMGERHVRFAGSIAPVFAQMLADVNLTMPDLVYDDKFEIDLGDRIVQLSHYGPGHTAGDQFAFLPGESILFAGDVLENKLCPVIEPGSRGGVGKWLDLLDALERLRPGVVVPGHGPLGDAALIGEYRSYLRKVSDATRAAQASGADVESYKHDLIAKVLSDFPDWGNTAFAFLVVDSLHAELAGLADERWRVGLQSVTGELGIPSEKVFAMLAPVLGDRAATQAINSAGEAWMDNAALTRRERSLLILTALAAANHPAERLRPNIALAIHNGVTTQDLEALASLLFVYSGTSTGAWMARLFREEAAKSSAVG